MLHTKHNPKCITYINIGFKLLKKTLQKMLHVFVINDIFVVVFKSLRSQIAKVKIDKRVLPNL